MTTVSVLVVADRAGSEHLADVLAAIDAQTYAPVETVLVTTPAMPGPVVREITARRSPSDRVVGSASPDRAGALRAAFDASTGDLVAWIAPSTVLDPGALACLVAAIERGADAAYCDHDERQEDGSVVTALKPDLSPERLRAHDYVGPVLVARREVAVAAGGPVTPVDDVVMHELALRTSESGSIAHVAQVLAHLRPVPSGATDVAVVDRERCRVVEAHCRRVGIDAHVVATGRAGILRVVRHRRHRPRISVVIPTAGSVGDVGGKRRRFVVEAVRSLVGAHDVELELVVVHDADTPPGVIAEVAEVAGGAVVAVGVDEPFNFSARMNAGVAAASSDLVLLLNDDTELIEPGSLAVMAAHLDEPDVAMVGAKLLFEDGTLQHGGHVYHHRIHHACFGWPGDSPGPPPLFPLAVERECSGVTAAAALVRRSAFDAVGGFDPAFPLNYNDVDLSLKLRAAGFRILWTPYAVWYHFESRSRVGELLPGEVALIEERWGRELRADPYYHPALSPDVGDWTHRPVVTSPPPPDAVSAVARARERIVRAVLGPPRSRPPGVNLVGYLDAASGLGDRARQLAAVLDAAGIRHSDWNVGLTDSDRIGGVAGRRADDGVVFDTTIAVVTALALPGVVGVHPPLFHDVDRVIGYWFWELAEIPETHRAGIDAVDEIWTPTRFVHDAYAAAVTVPVELVPLPIPPPPASGADRATFGFDDDRFVFLTSFDHLSSMQRKHPLGVIEAFVRAFPAGEAPVALVVKTINGGHRPDEVARLVAAAMNDDRIEIRDGYLDPPDQAALIRAADAFVSLHRSEGLGLHIAEAMWLGTPVVATRYSGSRDITDAAEDRPVAALVEFDLVDVVDGGEAYRSGVWADPDLDQAAAAMRRLATDDTFRSELVAAARRHVEAQSAPATAVELVAAVLARRARPTTRRDRVAVAVRAVRSVVRRAARR